MYKIFIFLIMTSCMGWELPNEHIEIEFDMRHSDSEKNQPIKKDA